MIRDSGGQQEKQQEREEASTRTAPVTHQEESRQVRRKLKKKQDKRKQSSLTSHATFVLSCQPPKQEIIDRIRKRNASEPIAKIAPHEGREHGEGVRNMNIDMDKVKDGHAANGNQRKRLRDSLEEQVEHRRVRNAIMVEQRRKSLEQNLINARNQVGHETSTTCMEKQSKDAAKHAFNILIKKVETLKR